MIIQNFEIYHKKSMVNIKNIANKYYVNKVVKSC